MNSSSTDIAARIRENRSFEAEKRVEALALQEAYSILNFVKNFKTPKVQKLFERRSEAIDIKLKNNIEWCGKLAITINELQGQLLKSLIIGSNPCPDPSIKIKILWRLETFRPRTGFNQNCWVDPLKEVSNRFTKCNLYLKFLTVKYQVVGLLRVCKTLLLGKGISNLTIIHYDDDRTYQRIQDFQEMIRDDSELGERFMNIEYRKKSINEVHMRRLEFFTAACTTDPALTIVCDRDFIDVGNPERGSWGVNFLYVKPYVQNIGVWKTGFYIDVVHSNTGWEAHRFLDIIFNNQTDLPNTSRRSLGETVVMSFRHVRHESQMRQLETLVEFFKGQEVKKVYIRTMLYSQMSEQAKAKYRKENPNQKEYTDQEEIAQQEEFANRYATNIKVIFDPNIKRYGDHSNSIVCLEANMKIISDEGLQNYKKDDYYAVFQRPRAFSLFILYE